MAEELKYTEATIRRWIKQGKLRAIRPTGREFRVRRADLEVMMGLGAPAPEPVVDGDQRALAATMSQITVQ